MKPIHLALVVVVGGACAPEADPEAAASDPVVGGRSAPARKNVPLLVALAHGEEHDCSATLIAPMLLLTAAHCVHPAYVGQGARFDAYVTASAFGYGGHVSVRAPIYDERFDPTAPQLGHDVAVLTLDQPLSGSPAPIPLARARLGDADVGRALTIVGFGAQDGADRRRETTLKVTALEPLRLRLDGDDGFTCTGDSGGPSLAIVDSVERVVGITSSTLRKSGVCGAYGTYQMRIDAHLDFIDRFLPPDALDDR